MNGSVHIVDHSVFKNLSPLAQATAIVLERRGMVRIVRDEEEEDEREGVANPARVLRSQTEPDQNLRLHQPGGALTLLIPRDA